jgi:hypothetical protein
LMSTGLSIATPLRQIGKDEQVEPSEQQEDQREQGQEAVKARHTFFGGCERSKVSVN